MEEEAPVVKLTYCILVAALRKRAERIRIDGNTSHCVVTFRIDGVDRVEMMPPALLQASIVRRIAVMANLPDDPTGGSAEGELILAFGTVRSTHMSGVNRTPMRPTLQRN